MVSYERWMRRQRGGYTSTALAESFYLSFRSIGFRSGRFWVIDQSSFVLFLIVYYYYYYYYYLIKDVCYTNRLFRMSKLFHHFFKITGFLPVTFFVNIVVKETLVKGRSFVLGQDHVLSPSRETCFARTLCMIVWPVILNQLTNFNYLAPF